MSAKDIKLENFDIIEGLQLGRELQTKIALRRHQFITEYVGDVIRDPNELDYE